MLHIDTHSVHHLEGYRVQGFSSVQRPCLVSLFLPDSYLCAPPAGLSDVITVSTAT